MAVTDWSGAAIQINSYDEYGAPAPGNAGRFGYTGQVWLPETGLYHYKNRAYNPELGRFMQTDPIGVNGGMNLYAYVGGDPVNFVDPLGLRQEETDEPPCDPKVDSNCDVITVTGRRLTLTFGNFFMVINYGYIADVLFAVPELVEEVACQKADEILSDPQTLETLSRAREQAGDGFDGMFGVVSGADGVFVAGLGVETMAWVQPSTGLWGYGASGQLAVGLDADVYGGVVIGAMPSSGDFIGVEGGMLVVDASLQFPMDGSDMTSPAAASVMAGASATPFSATVGRGRSAVVTCGVMGR